MWNSSLQLLMNVTGTNAISSSINNFDNVSEQELTVAPALFPFRNECIQVRFGDMEFIPWDNPDNILSREAETWFHRVQDNLIVVLFLIGGPANIINMLVFYKQGLSDRVNLLLFSLSFSDGMTLLTFMFVHAEQIHIQFTTQEKYGPIERFIWSSNVIGFAAFGYVSIVQVAIIATERCLCVYSPLKFQHLLKTRTMAIIIAMVYVSVLGLFFLVVFRYRIDCLYDQTNGMLITTFVEGEFYRDHKKLVDYVDSVTYGVGLPGTVLVVVLTMTILTIVKLRRTASWRSDTSSAGSITPKEVALTKMLVGNSILFIICFSPDAVNHVSRGFVKEMSSAGRYHNFYLAAVWLGDMFNFFNATLNIFVYYSMGSRYRKTFWALFGRKQVSDKSFSSEASK